MKALNVRELQQIGNVVLVGYLDVFGASCRTARVVQREGSIGQLGCREFVPCKSLPSSGDATSSLQ